MKNLFAKSTDLKTFQLSENDTVLGNLFYEKWYSFNAKIETDNQSYDCLFKGIWGTELQVLKDNTVVGTFKTNWLGKIVAEFDGKKYLLTAKGFLKYHYVLLDENEQEIAAFRPDFSINKFRYDYTVESSIDLNPAFVLAILHCINYQISVIFMGAVAVVV